MKNSSQKSKVIVGLSGGVDSSVAALLLLEQGYQVEGLFMKNWEEDDTAEYCSAAEDVADAQAVCDVLGIPLHTMNFAHEYWENVFSHFLETLKQGHTPNPDILCNKEIKFSAFLDYALTLGADYIATGHYVRRADHNGRVNLLKGKDKNKDQSYFLHSLNQEQLSKSLFPIGDYDKSIIRQRAAQAGFITHDKKDSTGICFIGERKFKTFLKEYLPAQPGAIINEKGETIGQHDGLMYYTIGQRQGLNIGGLASGNGQPWYVQDKDLINNQLRVVQGHDHPALLREQLLVTTCHWIDNQIPTQALHCRAKTRYRQEDQACIVNQVDTGWQVTFEQPQRAITPGQSVVFYQEDVCLGGGVIASIS